MEQSSRLDAKSTNGTVATIAPRRLQTRNRSRCSPRPDEYAERLSNEHGPTIINGNEPDEDEPKHDESTIDAINADATVNDDDAAAAAIAIIDDDEPSKSIADAG